MAADREKRSSQGKATSWGDDEAHQVGGRRPDPESAGGGGGYQGSCGTPTSHLAAAAPRDPRIDELERMGLGRHHIRVAEAIGFDAFLTMWRLYDEEPACRKVERRDGQPIQLEITLRSYRSYLRFQRNRTIEAMFAEGLGIDAIQKRLKEMLCEKVSLRHIRRFRGGR